MNFLSGCLNLFNLLSSYLTSGPGPVFNTGQTDYYKSPPVLPGQCMPWDMQCRLGQDQQTDQGRDQQQKCSECKSGNPLVSHYRDSGCKLNINPQTCCPTSADCRFLNEIGKRKSGCHYRGKTYKSGEEIKEATCRNCQCSRKEISCPQDGCMSEWRGPNKGCVFLYDLGGCCSREQYCPGKQKGQKKIDYKCNYNGQSYLEGEKFQAKDPCKSCICTKAFRDVDNKHCTVLPCLLSPGALKQMKRGCLPIFSSRDTCCPIEFHCAPLNNQNKKQQQQQLQQQGSTSYTANPNQCVFSGKNYAIGAKIPIKQKCVTCKCEIPPLGTCLLDTNCNQGGNQIDQQ